MRHASLSVATLFGASFWTLVLTFLAVVSGNDTLFALAVLPAANLVNARLRTRLLASSAPYSVVLARYAIAILLQAAWLVMRVTTLRARLIAQCAPRVGFTLVGARSSWQEIWTSWEQRDVVIFHCARLAGLRAFLGTLFPIVAVFARIAHAATSAMALWAIFTLLRAVLLALQTPSTIEACTALSAFVENIGSVFAPRIPLASCLGFFAVS